LAVPSVEQMHDGAEWLCCYRMPRNRHMISLVKPQNCRQKGKFTTGIERYSCDVVADC